MQANQTRGPLSSRAPLAAFLALNALLLLALALRAPQITLDTRSYLQHAITRTPGYPLYLDFMALLTGSFAAQMKLAQVVQLVVGFLAAGHLALTLRRAYGLGPLTAAIVYGLLLVPQVRCGQVICTESLSYSLFLLLLAALCRSFFTHEARHSALAAAALLGLLLIRPQFVFLVPLGALYLGWLLLGRRGHRGALIAAAGLCAALAGSALGQAAHTYAYHGRFARIPFTGIQVLSVAMYLADPADAARLGDERAARYLGAVFEKIDENRWHGRYRASHQSIFEHFNAVYPDLCYRAVVPAFLPIIGKQALGPDDWAAMDSFTLRIALRLLWLHKREFAVHVLKQIQDTGGYLPLLMALCVALGLLYHRRTGDGAALLPVAAGLMGWGNYLLVALVEPLGTRYLIYTENIQLPLLLCLCVYLARPALSLPLRAVPQGLQHHLQKPALGNHEIA